MYTVYVIRNNVNDHLYVGKTKSLKHRWKGHKRDAQKGDQRHLYRSMRLYGLEAFSCENIASCVFESDAYTVEREVIAQFKQQGMSLYNCNDGGSGNHTGNKNKLISDKLKEVWTSDEKRKALGVSVKEALSNPEVKAKLGKKGSAHSLAKLTEEQVLEMRQLYKNGTTTVEIAKRFNKERRNVWAIVTFRVWKHLLPQ